MSSMQVTRNHSRLIRNTQILDVLRRAAHDREDFRMWFGAWGFLTGTWRSKHGFMLAAFQRGPHVFVYTCYDAKTAYAAETAARSTLCE